MGQYVLIKEISWRGVILPAGSKTPEISDRKAEWLHDQGAIVLPGRKPPIAKAQQSSAAQRSAPRRSSGGCCGWR